MKRQAAALAAAVLAAGACKDSTGVPDLNNPSVESVGGALSKSNLQTLTTGVLDQERRSLDYPFFVFPATMSRDVLRLDNSESRFESETLELPPSPGGFLSRGFSPYYVAIKAANNLLAAVPRATSELTAGDKSAITGFVRTLKANDFYRVFETRGDQGLPIAVDDPTKLAPIVCTPKVLDYLAALLDSAYTDLQAAQAAGTTTYPATLPAGWTSIGGDYGKISNMIKYNRGLKGKIDVYRGIGGNAGAYATAITALDIALGNSASPAGTALSVTAADLAAGPYYQFSTLSGEVTNPLADPRIHFQPSVFDSLQSGDARGSKIVVQSTPTKLTVDGYAFSTLYDPAVSVASNPGNSTRPIPILKNEELYLLRAQAEIGAGQLDKARSDINTVRTVSGGLGAYLVPFTNAAAAIDAVLYEKRYSLLTDGGQRLVDLRAYGRLNATTFPAGSGTTRSQLSPYSGDPFNKQLPYPQAELDARGGSITCQ